MEDEKISIDLSLLKILKNYPDSSRKEFLRWLVAECWGSMPPWTTLEHSVIEEVQKATVGSGAVFIHTVDHVDYVLLAEAGPHYKKTEKLYMIPGGFVNLSRTPGSSFVEPSDKPESPRNALARECEEELKNADGTPLLEINPSRFEPMDMNTIYLPWGETRVVIGSLYEMRTGEYNLIKNHIAKLNTDTDFKMACAEKTINPDSNLPEVASLILVKLTDVINEKVKLLHADQMSLFQAVHYRVKK
jgi:hypothetical protein